MKFEFCNLSFNGFGPINLDKISRLELAKMIKDSFPAMRLSDAFKIAAMIHEAHRLGKITGAALR